MRPPPCAGAAGLDRRAVGIGDAGLVPATWNLPEFVSASFAAFSRSSGRCHKAESERCWLVRAKLSLIAAANLLMAQAVNGSIRWPRGPLQLAAAYDGRAPTRAAWTGRAADPPGPHASG